MIYAIVKELSSPDYYRTNTQYRDKDVCYHYTSRTDITLHVVPNAAFSWTSEITMPKLVKYRLPMHSWVSKWTVKCEKQHNERN